MQQEALAVRCDRQGSLEATNWGTFPRQDSGVEKPQLSLLIRAKPRF
jgi:hypothetical protein